MKFKLIGGKKSHLTFSAELFREKVITRLLLFNAGDVSVVLI